MGEQNLTELGNKTTQGQGSVKLLTFWQEQYISFCATGGMVTAEDGTIGKMLPDGTIDASGTMKVQEFAAMAGVSRTTLFNWQRSIPNFWDKVAARRKELGGQHRVQKVWNGIYLKAAAGNPQAAALFLANHDPSFKMPMQKVEHEVGNSWGALLQAKSNVISHGDTQEGQVIDVEPTN